jgi:hypothetical protein
MRREFRGRIAALIILLTSSCGMRDEPPAATNDNHLSTQTAQLSPASMQRNPAMSIPSASRPAPPVVAPIELDGVRYQQDNESRKHGGDQSVGYLVAIDIQSGGRLWMQKIYEYNETPTPGAPSPMGLYFKSMKLDATRGAILIENESGGGYELNIKTRAVTLKYAPASRPSQNNYSDLPLPPPRKP